ncbi:MAG: DUF1573 domain-containing protein [Desulfobacterales bacterium]|nr:DUF1573 domain-containing protein [Desulfobacterales bacterium]
MIMDINWKKSAVILLAVAVISGCAVTPNTNKRAGPALTLDNAVYDFEYAGPTQTIEHEFRFSNTGKSAIAITGLSVCCGCEAKLTTTQQEVIPPGQSGTVLVTCTLPRYEGPFEKVITLHTGAPDTESIPLSIKGMIKKDVVVIPSSVFFDTLKKEETSQKRLRVLQMSNHRLSINKVEADPNLYAIEFTRFDNRNHRGYDVTIEFSANVPVGIYSDVITIYTNDKRRSKIDVPIIAQVVE